MNAEPPKIGGDAGTPSERGHRVTQGCADARRGLAYYRRQVNYWRDRMGAGSAAVKSDGNRKSASCPHVRRSAKAWRIKAARAHRVYLRWSWNWEWQRWLPTKFYRVARCETGVNWTFDSGTYVSAFGIIRVAFPSWNGHNTPREQYRVADSIRARYGWSAWGCGGA